MRYIGVRSEILPYPTTDKRNDDLSDVLPSEKFVREFPDGKVPIRDCSHLFFRTGNETDHWLALADTISLFDRSVQILGRVDRHRVEPLLNEYRILREANETSRAGILPVLERDKAAYDHQTSQASHTGDRPRAIIRELVGCGLSLRALRAIVRSDQLEYAYPKPFALGFQTWETLDKRCLAGESYKAVADDMGLHPTTVLGWYWARGYDDTPVREECAWLLSQHRKDFGPKASRAIVWEYMAEKYPWCWLKPEAVMKRLGRDGEPERKDTWTKPW